MGHKKLHWIRSALPRDPDRNGTGAQAGFTLIELLIGLTLLGLVMAILASGLRFGARVWESKSVRSEQLSETHIVHGFLQRLVEGAHPYEDGQNGHIEFSGSHSELSFVAPLPSYVGYGGYHRVHLLTENNGGQRQILLRHELLHPDISGRRDQGDVSGETLLLKGIDDFEISYLDTGGTRSKGVWRGEWKHQNRLPDGVKIDISFDDSDPRIWPSLIATPMIGLATSCLREPKASQCQSALLAR